MKEKSSKQSKKDKPAVQIKDLTPTRDSKGQVSYRREMPGGMEPLRRRPGQFSQLQTRSEVQVEPEQKWRCVKCSVAFVE
jgi:hypothetical protein